MTIPSPGLLTVNLDALARNYQLLRGTTSPAACGAVVKADAYGLGVGPVAKCLYDEGCRHFFVATLGEGVELREILGKAEIYVLEGVLEGHEHAVMEARLVPVLNSLEQVRRWTEQKHAGRYPAVLHIDTGITRLGLGAGEVEELAREESLLQGMRIAYVMTHLACADEPSDPLNAEQLRRFDALRRRLPEAKTCIGNSAGVLMGAGYRGDLARPGIALYGGNPFTDGTHNPMEAVVRLQGVVIQVREVKEALSVGYGATHQTAPPARLATVGIGYADGYPLTLGNRGFGSLGGARAPVVGRVSMDLITLDVSDVAGEHARPGALVEFIGEDISLDELAEAAGTISYEILTRLGPRLHRTYRRDRA